MIWDVSQVFKYFRSLDNPENLNLKKLSQKLALLLVLLSGGQRCQTIDNINVLDIKIVEDVMVIPILEKIKQSKPGNHMPPLKFKCYVKEPKLCVVTHMTQYLKTTMGVRGNTEKLFLSFQKPHGPVGKDTIARWCKTLLRESGIDVNIYSSHSSRSAATSKAKSKGWSTKDIAKYAGWKGEATFAKFYRKKILQNETFQDKLF